MAFTGNWLDGVCVLSMVQFFIGAGLVVGQRLGLVMLNPWSEKSVPELASGYRKVGAVPFVDPEELVYTSVCFAFFSSETL